MELIIFCGSPGAGKSTFYWQHLQPLGYERVNQDILKTRDKCMKVATEFLEDKKSVVVDNTNADIETRAAWISLGKKLKVPTRLVHFTASTKLCEHNDAVRAFAGDLVGPFCAPLFRRSHFLSVLFRLRPYRSPLLHITIGFLTVHVYGRASIKEC
jgi:bifunctional polynucleotide phosphatase/kinase